MFQSDLRTVTSISTSSHYDKDRMWLNGDEQDIESNHRMQACLQEVYICFLHGHLIWIHCSITESCNYCVS